MRSVIIAFLFYISSSICLAQPVQLATVYDGEDVSNYLVSEKLDGIRAIWDGKQLFTRSGHPISAPSWFTEGWPEVWLDGELWIGRRQFSLVQQTVLDDNPDEKMWRNVHYMVFDAPDLQRTFEQRANYYTRLLFALDLPYIQPIPQYHIDSVQTLYQRLDDIVEKGGEGLMLHRCTALFKDGRSDALLKLKPHRDAEAKVVAHIAGKGKYANMLGALEVELANGRRFRIGTGFSDEQRANPPKAGEFVTFRYQGFTSTGLPRFASFLRIRKDEFDFVVPK